ncbi:MAG: Secretion system C-terminal sorting domain [Bacteroidota bacterium]
MIPRILIFCFCSFPIRFLTAQTIDRSAMVSWGGWVELPAVQASHSAGETFIATLSNGNVLLTQGFQQPDVVEILGCINPLACNFNPEANKDDGSCILPQPESCNGLDDNCDGQVDEGLTSGSVNAIAVTTNLFPVCSGNGIKSANLNNGTNSAIIDGNGLDLWYSMTAQYNTLRASLSAAFGDNEIRLYSYNNGCFQLIETEHEVYTASTAATGNQVLITDDLLVGQTYYITVHNISGPMNSSAKMCFNHFVESTCDHYYSNNTGIYPNVCTSFKAQYKGNASNYNFDILSATQNNANLNITPWNYITTSANSVVSRLGTIFPANMSNAAKVYTLRIPVIYAIPDAAGNYTSITANATTTCTVTLNAELPIALRASDRCPNTKTTTSSISVDRTICGAQRYEWEFTQQLPSVQAPVSVLGGLNTTVFFLNNVPVMGTGKTYNVRVRPIHANGEVGNWGTAQCLKTGTAGMVLQSESASRANNYSPRQAVSLYPNPTSTGRFTLMTNSAEEEVKQIVITDITGKMVFQSQVVMNGNSVEVEFGDLATGMYLVMVGEERIRLIIE